MNDGNNSTTTDSSDHPQTLSPDLQIQTQTPFSDPLTNPHLSLNDLSPELTSLHELAIRGSWRSIIDKVAQARKLSLPTTQPHHNLTYTSYYLLALTKLRRYDEALLDLSNLHDLDSPHYHYESYPDHYPNRYGSMVPFSLRWIHAQIPFRLGNRQETLDRLYTLLDFVRTKLKDKESKNLNDSVSIWNNREDFVTNSIISHHLSHKEFIICLDLIKDLIRRDSSNPILLSKLGYIQMQLGDLEGAKAMFNRVEGLMGEGKSGELLTEIEFKNLVNRNKALVYLVGKDYVSAVREYEECIERDSSDAVAINNKALCLMYLRDLSDSIKVLENALERVPTAALNETIVVNLCSMYELAYVNHSDIKRTLSNWIARVAPDDFDASCTRI